MPRSRDLSVVSRPPSNRTSAEPSVLAEPSTATATGARVITFGTFDLFHVGHLHLLRRAREAGDRLIVGVSSDDLNLRKKGQRPVIALEDRMAIVAAIRFVDEVFVEESLELKGEYIRGHRADLLVMGNDWQGRFDHHRSQCRVLYLPRTPEISSSGIVSTLRAAS